MPSTVLRCPLCPHEQGSHICLEAPATEAHSHGIIPGYAGYAAVRTYHTGPLPLHPRPVSRILVEGKEN